MAAGDQGSARGRAEAERRRALRRVARTHHPDLGGDAEVYLAAVAAVERGGAGRDPGRRTTRPPVHVLPAPRMIRLLRRLRRRWRARRLERRHRRRSG